MPNGGRGNVKLQEKRRRDRNRAFVDEYKKTHPCIRCGETDPKKLTFHHRDPEQKLFNLANKAELRSKIKLLTEIAKCDILCLTCHQIRHNILDKRVKKEMADGKLHTKETVHSEISESPGRCTHEIQEVFQTEGPETGTKISEKRPLQFHEPVVQ